ncbi:hypothetical protein PTKIN_Ptkin17bG0051100 [Pterospermum kingtungense]
MFNMAMIMKLAWRLFSYESFLAFDVLKARKNLADREIIEDKIYFRCNVEEENRMHAVRDCIFSRQNHAIIRKNEVGAADTIPKWSSPDPDLGFTRVVFEGDALSIIKRLRHTLPDLSAIGAIIEEARLLKSRFLFKKFIHVSRDATQATHTLAKTGLALMVKKYKIWEEDCPSHFLPIVISDAI